MKGLRIGHLFAVAHSYRIHCAIAIHSDPFRIFSFLAMLSAAFPGAILFYPFLHWSSRQADVQRICKVMKV